MVLLILGLALWIGGHLFKRIAPARRAAMGERGKGVVGLVLLLSVVLMVIGYRGAPYVPVYDPLPGMGHVNNTLMLLAVFLFGVGGTKGLLYPRMRHPMLWGTVIWAVAHLLVNGDLASVILFGGIGLWALGAMQRNQPCTALDAADRRAGFQGRPDEPCGHGGVVWGNLGHSHLAWP